MLVREDESGACEGDIAVAFESGADEEWLGCDVWGSRGVMMTMSVREAKGTGLRGRRVLQVTVLIMRAGASRLELREQRL